MEFFNPYRITSSKFGKGNFFGVPFGDIWLTRSIGNIGQNCWDVVYPVKFHHINFSVRWPAVADTQRPDGRPCAHRCVYSCPYFEPSVQPLFQTMSIDA